MLRLTVVQAPEGQTQIGESITIGHEGASIGRGAENTWRLVDEQRLLSRVHLTVVHEAGKFTLADLSSNGAYLNGVLLGRGNCEVINHGDRIRLGDYDLLADLPEETVSETYTATEVVADAVTPEPGDATFVADPEKWLMGQLGLGDCESPDDQGAAAAGLAAEPPETLASVLAELAGIDAAGFSEAEQLDVVRALAQLVTRSHPQLARELNADNESASSPSAEQICAALRRLGEQ